MLEEHSILGAFADAEILHYLVLKAGVIVDLNVARENVAVASQARHFPGLDWDEREMRDIYGVQFTDHPDPRPLLILNGVFPEAVVAQGKGITNFIVGPVHAGIIEPGRFTFSSGGESVIHLDAQLSYARRNIEGFLEGRDAAESAWHVARICAACSVARSWSYARGLEALAGVEIDCVSELVRMTCAEMERAYNHLFDIAVSSAGAGFGFGLTRGLQLKERFARLNEVAFGHRYLFDVIVPGGVRPGMLQNRISLEHALCDFEHDVINYCTEVFDNPGVSSRFAKTGVLTDEYAHAYAGVGPAARASGGSLDIRLDAPYGAYREMAPIRMQRSQGDVAARCHIKRDEMLDALRLIKAALHALGDARIPEPKPLIVGAGNSAMVTEGPRGAETVYVCCNAEGRIERFHAISASYRNWPLVIKATQNTIVPDFPLVNKSFNLCYACVDR